MRKKFRVTVTIELKENPTVRGNQPDEYTAEGEVARGDVIDFVKDAVGSWGGQCPPNYPFWPQNMEVTVK